MSRRAAEGLAALLLAVVLAGVGLGANDSFRQSSVPPFTYLYSDFPPRDVERLAARLRERLPELARDLAVEAPEALTLLLLSPDQEERFFGSGASAPSPWVQGFAVPAHSALGGQPLLVVRLRTLRGYPHREVAAIAEHELVHVLLWRGAGPRASSLPRWFQEGCAMWMARGWRLDDSMRLLPAAMGRNLPPMEAIEHSFPSDEAGARLAYAQAFAFTGFLVDSYGPSLPARILEGVRAGAPFAGAFRAATGTTLAETEHAWRGRIDFLYRWVPLLGSSFALWGGVSLAVIAGYVRKRRRAREILRRWDEEERRAAGAPPPANPEETVH